MTNEEKRIAISEACGWQFVNHEKGTRLINPAGEIVNQFYAESWRLPDYLNDLNAMHEAEGTLSAEELEQYPFHFRTGKGSLYGQFLRMTAPQRADAFLKVKGLFTTPNQEGK